METDKDLTGASNLDSLEKRQLIIKEIEKGVKAANEELGTNYLFDESSLSIKNIKETK